MSKRFTLLFVFSLICVGNLPVRADTITDPSNGVAYTLTYSPTANPNALDLKLVIDTTNYSARSTDKLADVALKIVNKKANAGDFTLTSSPGSYAQPQFGGLSSAGCDGKGMFYLCDDFTGSGYGLALGAGDIYTFEWSFTGTLSEWELDSHVKAEYVRTDGKHAGKSAGNTSQDITLTELTPPPDQNPIPEPSTLLLLGSGLASGAALLRRRFSSSSK